MKNITENGGLSLAILTPAEIRKLSSEERENRLTDLHVQVIKFRSKVVSGGTIESPGLLRELKRTIARINTINHEERLKNSNE